MNQEDLSAETGIAIDTISRIETGQRPYPRRSTVFALADALGVKPNDLLKSGHPLSGANGTAGDDAQSGPQHRAG